MRVGSRLWQERAGPTIETAGGTRGKHAKTAPVHQVRGCFVGRLVPSATALHHGHAPRPASPVAGTAAPFGGVSDGWSNGARSFATRQSVSPLVMKSTSAACSLAFRLRGCRRRDFSGLAKSPPLA